MRELAAGQVDDRHQVTVRAESTRSGDRRLDFRVDGFGGAVGQTQSDAVDDAVQMIAYGRPQPFEGLEPTAPCPGDPSFELWFGFDAGLGSLKGRAQRFLEPPGTRGLEIRARQPMHVVDLGSRPVPVILERAPAQASSPSA